MLLFDTQTQSHSFTRAATTRRYLTSVLSSQSIDLVVMEACGPSGWISDLSTEHGIETLVCSTNEEAWKWRNVKRKTDRDDALKLARLAMLRQLTPVHVPAQQVRGHRTLVKYRLSSKSRRPPSPNEKASLKRPYRLLTRQSSTSPPLPGPRRRCVDQRAERKRFPRADRARPSPGFLNRGLDLRLASSRSQSLNCYADAHSRNRLTIIAPTAAAIRVPI